MGSLLFAMAVFLIGNQHNFFSKHVELFTEFKNLNGLAKGAKIRVAGFDAGEVAEISVPDSPAAGFRLTLRITDQVRGLIRTDSVATIATEGVVGDKVLLIGPGSSTAAGSRAISPHCRAKKPAISRIWFRKARRWSVNASDTMKVVADKLTTTLDAVTTTVNNADDLVVGLKQGRGAIGMLLRDEKTATDIRAAIANARDATSSLNHASAQADALVSDFQSRGLGAKVDGMMGKADAIVSDLQSRNFGEKIDQTMENVHSAAHNIDVTTQQLQETLAKALAPDAHGQDAGDNIRETLSNVNDATANITEDTEALKHGFLFRGYFKSRGYYSMARLAPDKYRQDKVFVNPKNTRVWIEAAELFEPKQGGQRNAFYQREKRGSMRRLSSLGSVFSAVPSLLRVTLSPKHPADDLALSRSRASLVRNYLHARFQLENREHRNGPAAGSSSAVNA